MISILNMINKMILHKNKFHFKIKIKNSRNKSLWIWNKFKISKINNYKILNQDFYHKIK